MSVLALGNTGADCQVIDSETFEFISASSYDSLAEIIIYKESYIESKVEYGKFSLGNCSISAYLKVEGINDDNTVCPVGLYITVNDSLIKIPIDVVLRNTCVHLYFKKLSNCLTTELGYHFFAVTNTEIPKLDIDVPFTRPFYLLVFNKKRELVLILDSRNMKDFSKFYCIDAKLVTLVNWKSDTDIKKLMFN